ncbi:hypothetical protein NDA11_006009 [Ustilago hordei]|uniref:Cytoplasmic tRNA 2-thiolation protein 2 n=1 Tax=Ustilago hordei TaxID=120017 RepID=I2FXZ4_USTHO|nr:uncharacterized protein UHO2_00277 [Ustilago hordei]KAJ1041273.1 hypothetical protein NDA10_002910 [Ustilago hordei]KAJ1570952.1 hypothetical protein NDA11_006009 [Ustilago hordei]KAJ1587707.1 hypothetical protein NDA15_007803 [Ustilago hordei]KAJ1590408.1 hypothetical protein NDA12_007040 [Ustilago hordei]UTT96789.1 hypothetical protein NDA17_003486 [Ustilago hordei]
MPCPQPDGPNTTALPDTATSTICVKCRMNPAISIFRDSIYCQSCALAVFYQKAKSGLEYARGAGLAKYVAAAKAAVLSDRPAASTSTTAPTVNGEGSKTGNQINNGGGNAEVNVSASIAVAFSGGSSSRALLRSAVQYFRPETVVDRTARRKKGRGDKADPTPIDSASSERKNSAGPTGRFNEVGKIYVFFIDDSALIPDGVDQTEEVRKMVEEENCPDLHFVPLKIEDIYRTTSSSAQGVAWRLHDSDTQHLASTSTSVSNPTQAIKDLFASLHPTSTPRTGASSARTRVEDLHRILIATLLRSTASEYDCSALLLGDSATRISIRLIEDLAKGAGHKLPVQGSDAVWIDDLLVVRPLKGHLMQEILFYTSALGLEPLFPEQHVVLSTVSTNDICSNTNSNVPAMDKSSIAKLTETFILNLEKGVPSTVTTIGKTGSKLVLNQPTSTAQGEEGVANSTSSFQQVGPSVSLRSRAQIPPTTGMAGMTLSDPSEPRIGSRGIKLAQTSASCFNWSTSSGCALCGMPSQHPHARHWKRDITISSLAETAPSQQKHTAEEGKEKGWLELADHLCYACLLVLSPPDAGIALLPAYVLDHILRATTQADTNGVEAHVDGERTDDDDMDAANGSSGHKQGCGTHETPQPLKQSEMKAQINEFLLED